MTDVIDSLKRLERVGSENSKTTEKLINAAQELSSLIADSFRPGPDEEIPVVEGITEIEPNTFLGYTVRQNDFRQGESHAANLYEHGIYVAKNRQAALTFAKHISNGLLDLIIESLEKRKTESTEALSHIEDAAATLRKKPFEF